jgi:hypothetical protein
MKTCRLSPVGLQTLKFVKALLRSDGLFVVMKRAMRRWGPPLTLDENSSATAALAQHQLPATILEIKYYTGILKKNKEI